MLLGIARLYSEKTTLLWATLGHPETLLRVDNSTQLEHPETLLLGIIRLYTGTVDLLFLMAPLLGRDLLDPM